MVGCPSCPRESGRHPLPSPGHQHAPAAHQNPKPDIRAFIPRGTRSIARRGCLEWLLLLQPAGAGAESLAGGGRFSGGEVSAGRGQAHRYGGRQVELCHLGPVPGRATTTTCEQPAVRGSLQPRLSADPLPLEAPATEPPRRAEECVRLWGRSRET